jgi:hypothetical protein
MDLNRRTPPLAAAGISETVADVQRSPAVHPHASVAIVPPAHNDGVGTGDGELDTTPPPDHEGFLEVRALGLRAMREKLDRRRKTG